MFDRPRSTFTGTITDVPDRRFAKILYTVDLRGTATGKVLVTDRFLWPVFHYGDEISITGTMTRPEAFEDFDYEAYLHRFGITATLSADRITLTKAAGFRVRGMLFGFRELFEARIMTLFPEPTAGLLAGLLTGARGGLSPAVNASFQRTGLSHITAVSGTNISIVIAMMSTLLFWLPLRWRFIPLLIGIAAFTILTGASASVVRAGIMGSLGLLALHTGRLTHVWLTIIWTAFAMLLWNPLMLTADAGFQLSFLSVIGLAALSPFLLRMMEKIPNAFGLRESLAMTLSAQVFTLPVVAREFGTMSIITPIANILIAPLLPLAMLFGFLTVLANVLSHTLATMMGFLAFCCLQLIIDTAKALGDLPMASVIVPRPSIVLGTVYYTVLAAILFLKNASSTHPHSDDPRHSSASTKPSPTVRDQIPIPSFPIP